MSCGWVQALKNVRIESKALYVLFWMKGIDTFLRCYACCRAFPWNNLACVWQWLWAFVKCSSVYIKLKKHAERYGSEMACLLSRCYKVVKMLTRMMTSAMFWSKCDDSNNRMQLGRGTLKGSYTASRGKRLNKGIKDILYVIYASKLYTHVLANQHLLFM